MKSKRTVVLIRMSANGAEINHTLYSRLPDGLHIIVGDVFSKSLYINVGIKEAYEHAIDYICACKSGRKEIGVLQFTNGSRSAQCLDILLLFRVTADHRNRMSLLYQFLCQRLACMA